MLVATATLGVNLANAAPFAYVTNAYAPSVAAVATATNQVTAKVAFPAGSVTFAAATTTYSKKFMTPVRIAVNVWPQRGCLRDGHGDQYSRSKSDTGRV